MSELNGIYEHLNELRTRVLRVVIVVGIIAVFLMTFHFESISYGGIMFYYPSPEPLDNIAAQLTNYFEINLVPEGVQLIQTAPGQAFFAQIYIAALTGLVAGTPIIIREIVSFLKPALKENEINVGRTITVPIMGLFISGCLFAYFVVIPFMLDFL
ncbi:MAG: twin-arginine translocase subunit TatC, partial [Thermoproteota archaeon]|nr:twin-arginine translocase subunit TatC [Thermoproteota archaeon]